MEELNIQQQIQLYKSKAYDLIKMIEQAKQQLNNLEFEIQVLEKQNTIHQKQ